MISTVTLDRVFFPMIASFGASGDSPRANTFFRDMKRTSLDSGGEDGADANNGPPMQRRRFIMEQEFGPAEPPPEEEWENCSFEETESKREFVHSACWACRYGHLIEDKKKHPAHYALFKLLSQYWGKMSNKDLFENMHRHHEYYIRDPIIKDGGECMAWPTEIVQEHVLKHMNDPTIELTEQIREHRIIKGLLKNKITIRNKQTGEMQHDLKVINAVLQVSKNIRELHNSKPEKGFLYDRTLKIGSDDN